MTPTELDKPLKSAAQLPPWLLWCAGLLLLAMAALYDYSTSFSHFSFYDDEGFMMVGIRGYLDGQPLYDGIFTYYGPFYYFYEWMVHGAAGLPLSNDATRDLCVVHWLAASIILAFAGGQMTKSALAGFFIFVLATLHLTPLANEPGHPQEFVVLLLAATSLVAPWWLRWRWTGAVLGGIGAALLLTKVNAGVFFGCALALVWACHAAVLQSRRTWAAVMLMLGGLLPFVLMRQQLAQDWVRDYCLQACSSILAVSIIAYAFNRGARIGSAALAQLIVAFTAVSAGFIVVRLLGGSSPGAMMGSLVSGPAKFSATFYGALLVPHIAWSGAASLTAACTIVALRKRLDSLRLGLLMGKAALGVLGTVVLAADYRSQLGYLLPWCWLLLVEVPGVAGGKAPDSLGRSVLAIVACCQSLLVYPIAGTQVVVATTLVVLICAICLHDAMLALASLPVTQHLRETPARTVVMAKLLALLGLLVLFDHWCAPLSSWKYYTSLPQLALHGASRLRLPSEQAGTYRALAAFLERESDAFITIPGLNSLYFWTGQRPPTYYNVAEVLLLTEAQQTQVTAALQRAKRPMVVLNDVGIFPVTDAGPLTRFIKEQYREIKRIGTFHILAPKPF